MSDLDAEQGLDHKCASSMLETLVCPVTQSLLEYNPDTEELISRMAGLAFPIREGIPIMLVDAARNINND